MAPAARVLSTESLGAYHAALARFAAQATNALCAAELTVRRAMEGLEERLRRWTREAHVRQEEVARARAALSMARVGKEGSRAGLAELELTVKRCQRRLREAEDKLVAVRRWQRAIPEALRDYEGPVHSLASFLDGDARAALVYLERKLALLDAYAADAPPSEPIPASGGHQPPVEDANRELTPPARPNEEAP